MATHAFIFHAENTLIQARESAKELKRVFEHECEVEDNRGQPYPQNKDCYAMALVNAKALRRELDALILAMGKTFPREVKPVQPTNDETRQMIRYLVDN